MSKGVVLGGQLWTQKWHWDFPMMLGVLTVPCFIGAVYTAYLRMSLNLSLIVAVYRNDENSPEDVEIRLI
jgi:hypothetical protein